MKTKWIPAVLVVGLLAAAITGGAVLASGGDDGGNGGPDGEEVVVKDGDVATLSIENTEVESGGPDELALRVAEILGTEPQATYDAMVRADQVDADPLEGDGHADAGDEDSGDADSGSVDATGMSYMDYGERIGVVLGVDGESVARAVAQAYEELYGVERDIRENGSGRDAEGREDTGKHSVEPAGG